MNPITPHETVLLSLIPFGLLIVYLLVSGATSSGKKK